MYLYSLFTITVVGLCLYHAGNLLQLWLDLLYLGKNPTIVTSVRRIQPLLIKYRRQRRLGRYERYVLEREINHYTQFGGKMDYFISGSGSENCTIS